VDETDQPNSLEGAMDFSDSIGAFFVLSKQGKLFALKGIRISRDFRTLAPQVFTSGRFSVLYPLVSRIRASNVLLVVHPPQVYFLMDVRRGDSQAARQRVYAEVDEIISESLDDNLLPVLTLVEMERAVAASRRKQTPLIIRVRLLELKEALPQEWVEEIKRLFLLNCDMRGEKEARLTAQLNRIGRNIRNTLLSTYLGKCMWLDVRTTEFGTLIKGEDGIGFKAHDPYDDQFRSFVNALVKKPDGKYEANNEIGKVLPTPMRQNAWSAPTLHIHNPHFRTLNKLDEYYSLYKGMQALSRVGAPVLLYEGQNPLESPTQVSLLRISSRTPEIFQPSVREYPAKDLVWTEVSEPESIDVWS